MSTITRSREVKFKCLLFSIVTIAIIDKKNNGKKERIK